MYSHLF